MVQNSQLTNSLDIDPPAGLHNYFLPHPALMFTFIMLSAYALILATPIIIINTTALPQDTQNTVITITVVFLILLLVISCIRLIRYYLRLRPTNQEYDTWVRAHESPLHQQGLAQLLLDPSELIEKPQCIPGVVWPNSQEAEQYQNNGYPKIKWDRYGFPHASVNRFIFFYPTRDTVAMFTCDVNALPSARSFSRAQRYSYKEVVGFQIVDLNAPGYPANVLQQFEIHFTNGQSIGIPMSPSDQNVMDVVKLLNALLREHKTEEH